MGFDIARLDSRTRAQQGVKFIVRDPRSNRPVLTDDKQSVFITLAGSNSDIYEAAVEEAQRARADSASRGQDMTREMLRTERAMIVKACTMGWNFDMRDGQPFPFSPENAEALWLDRRVNWLLSEAYTFIQNEAHFLADTPLG